jgi:hypothetical protein
MIRVCSLISLGALLGACVGGENSASPSFIGNWTCTRSGSAMVTEGGQTQTMQLTTETDSVIVTSPAPGQLLIDDKTAGGDCPIQASYNGGSASITGGTCIISMTDDGGTMGVLTLTFNGGSFNLSPDGKTMSGNTLNAVTTSSGSTGTAAETFTCMSQ